MDKLAFFFIDDVIWTLRDITRQKPKSIFDNPFMKVLKKAHDEYGLTVQLNLFYRTDFAYGDDEFTLSEVPDTYKAEFEASSDWLRFGFHAKQEFPDYPYVNASYTDVKRNCDTIFNEIRRFAGEKSISYAVVPHWLPISKDGCKALVDCGVKFISPSVGIRTEFNGDDNILPFGHAARLRQNRKPETMLFTRRTGDASIASSICAYNHISDEQYQTIFGKNNSIKDEETGVRFRSFCGGPCLNHFETIKEIEERLIPLLGNEFVGFANHEQYFYPEHFAYQPNYADKIYFAAKLLHDNEYRFITADEMK